LVCSMCLALARLPAGDTARPGPDWPQWRGPHRDGVSEEKGLLQHWSSKGPPMSWKTSGLGSGLASVVISDGRIFTMGKRNNAVNVIARDAKNGDDLWAAPVTQGGDDPSSTPTVDGDRVYAVGPAGDLVCLQAADGKELWRKSFTRDFGGSVPIWKY